MPHRVLLTTGVALVVALTACTAPDTEPPAPAPTTVEAAVPASEQVTPERQPFLDALAAIDARLATDPAPVLSRTRAVCEDMAILSREEIVKLVPLRFDSLLTVDTAMGRKIVEAIESTKVCATFDLPD